MVSRAEVKDAGTVSTAVAVDDVVREVALREVLVEAADDAAVGELIDTHIEGDIALVRFAAEVEGYRGWQWSVTIALTDPARPTVSEVVLLPGPEALLAPAWVPWKERIRGEDLAPGDIFPPAPDDARIVPAYVQSDDPAVEELAVEIGLGRMRVMSREGREQAARRWHRGDFGPRSEMALKAPGTCSTCAFYLPVAGSLGAGFGVCGNEFSPAEGHVVDIAFGCGAHSEARMEPRSTTAIGDTVLDELALEVHVREDVEPGDGAIGADPTAVIGEDAAGDASDMVDDAPATAAGASDVDDIAEPSADDDGTPRESSVPSVDDPAVEA